MLARLVHIERYVCRDCGDEYKIDYSPNIKIDQTFRHGQCPDCKEKTHEELNGWKK